jgi:hypothetical protein
MSVLVAALVMAGAQAKPQGIERPYQYQNLAVYPVFASGKHSVPDYISLDEGLKTGQVRVVERESGGGVIVRPSPTPRPGRPEPQQQRQQGGGGDVNTLWLINESGRKLLLLAGEMVTGGKQDRILERDAIVPPGKEPVNLNVYCVEQGRWSYKAGEVASFGGGAMPDLNVRGAAQRDRSQATVWSNVESTLKATGTNAPSRAYGQNFENKEVVGRLDNYVSAIRKSFPESQAVGAVVAVNGRLIWIDRFASNSLFKQYWPKLIRSYAMEAIRSGSGQSSPPTFEEAMRFASARDGKKSYEVEEGVSKLVKIEADRHVIYELFDMGLSPELMLHESKIVR